MTDQAAYELARNVWRIPAGPADFVNIFALVDDDGRVTLVDTGLKNGPQKAAAGLAVFGKSPRDVARIVLTHAHSDHAGGAAALAEQSGAGIAIHETDAQWARDGKAPPRDRATFAGRFFNRIEGKRHSFPPVVVSEQFADGDVLPVAGGLRVVHTPGHTMGHVSLLHEPTGVLITGDAIWNVRKMRWCVRAFCTDIRMTEQTADVLGELDYEVAAFTHGKHIKDQARERVRTFLRDAERFGAKR
jgi:glyoxylase-like metal-dependent hydrolase (beta-lactamase superfamily II)